jgi:hypothetical protein
MATAATRREEKKLVEPSQRRIDLTPTGLLMEGDYTFLTRMMSVIKGKNRGFSLYLRALRVRMEE